MRSARTHVAYPTNQGHPFVDNVIEHKNNNVLIVKNLHIQDTNSSKKQQWRIVVSPYALINFEKRPKFMLLFLGQKDRRIIFKFQCALWYSLTSFLIAFLEPSNQMVGAHKGNNPRQLPKQRATPSISKTVQIQPGYFLR